MARISGVDLPREKRVEIGLTYVYGIGRVSSNRILAKAGINPDTRVNVRFANMYYAKLDTPGRVVITVNQS